MKHEFKVGDKGKTECGSGYEIILNDEKLGEYPIFAVITRPWDKQQRTSCDYDDNDSFSCLPCIRRYNKSGKSMPWTSIGLDLIPTKPINRSLRYETDFRTAGTDEQQ